MDKLIKQHQQMARGEGIKSCVPIETPFCKGPDHGKPTRGSLRDSQRRDNDGDKD